MAPAGLLGREAKVDMSFLTLGLSARTAPHIKTKAICMEKAKRLHTPFPQFSTTSKGVCLHKGTATAKATKVSSTAKIKGSGK